MDKSRILACDTPQNIGKMLSSNDKSHKMALGMPVSVQLYHALGGDGECPLTVCDGRRYLRKSCRSDIKSLGTVDGQNRGKHTAIKLSDGYFRYQRELCDVLCGVDLEVRENEIFCILGANGSGKSTLLRVLSGQRKLYKGKYTLYGKPIGKYSSDELYRGNIASLPQNPESLFVKNTLYEDLFEAALITYKDKKKADTKLKEVSDQLAISHLFEQHPYDLSGGEKQKAALAKVLLMNPKILFLDELTKGLDAYAKQSLADVLIKQREEGRAVVIVTHDVEFAAEYADRCAMFFDGRIVYSAPSVEFFSSGRYYTTAAARISRPMYSDAVTLGRLLELCRINGRRCADGEE